MERLRGFNIIPGEAADWPDEFIDQYLNDLEQQGRQEGRDRAIQILTEQGRWNPEPSDSSNWDMTTATAKEIDDWVGDDKARARRALTAEKKRDTPREGLTKKLEKMLEG